jgi:hypothetical protein
VVNAFSTADDPREVIAISHFGKNLYALTLGFTNKRVFELSITIKEMFKLYHTLIALTGLIIGSMALLAYLMIKINFMQVDYTIIPVAFVPEYRFIFGVLPYLLLFFGISAATLSFLRLYSIAKLDFD